METTKKCHTCKVERPLFKFKMKKNGGYTINCLGCIERINVYDQKNKEKKSIITKKSRIKNKERVIATRAAYYVEKKKKEENKRKGFVDYLMLAMEIANKKNRPKSHSSLNIYPDSVTEMELHQ